MLQVQKVQVEIKAQLELKVLLVNKEQLDYKVQPVKLVNKERLELKEQLVHKVNKEQ